MDKKVQSALEEAGYRFMDAADFLELTEEERQLVELRMVIRRKIRFQREKLNMTQQQLAKKMNSSQSRVAKMESGASDVSLDLMFRGFFAAGGRLSDLAPGKTVRKSKQSAPVKVS